jgi:hypothetical protein
MAGLKQQTLASAAKAGADYDDNDFYFRPGDEQYLQQVSNEFPRAAAVVRGCSNEADEDEDEDQDEDTDSSMHYQSTRGVSSSSSSSYSIVTTDADAVGRFGHHQLDQTIEDASNVCMMLSHLNRPLHR